MSAPQRGRAAHPRPSSNASPNSVPSSANSGNVNSGNVNSDLGLGRVLSEEAGERFINKDGSFNARREGLGWRGLSAYGDLLSLGWGPFFLALGTTYLLINAIFGLIYYLLGPAALSDAPAGAWPRYLSCFFFSVQTFGTIGFGHVYPVSVAADSAVTAEAFVGLLGVALATGMLFARFSRPTHRVLFSHTALVAPFQGGQAVMFRLINGRRTQLMEAQVEVIYSAFVTSPDGRRLRIFKPLTLERERVVFFPLAWTVVHPVTEDSPYWGATRESLTASDAEMLVLLTALDEVSHQNVRARTSYKASETRFGLRFRDMYRRSRRGHLSVDAGRLDETEGA